MSELLDEFQTGSIFWIIQILIAFSGLVYLGIWGFFNASAKAIAITTIFSLLMIFSILITKFEIFKYEMDFLKSCASYSWGFLLFVGIAGLIKVASGGNFLYSVFSSLRLPKQSLFATISGELPVFWDMFVNNFTVPVAEESFWLWALPIGIIWIMNSASSIGKLQFLKNHILQTIVTIIISAGTFAIFHVGSKLLLSFIISAVIFRSILLAIVYGDIRFDIFPFAKFLPSFALGAHQANNIMSEGLMNFIVVMKSEWFGVFILIFLATIIIIGVLESIDQFIPGFDIGNNDGVKG